MDHAWAIRCRDCWSQTCQIGRSIGPQRWRRASDALRVVFPERLVGEDHPRRSRWRALQHPQRLRRAASTTTPGHGLGQRGDGLRPAVGPAGEQPPQLLISDGRGFPSHRPACPVGPGQPRTRAAIAILDVVSGEWLTTLVSAEELSTRVDVVLTTALAEEGPLDTATPTGCSVAHGRAAAGLEAVDAVEALHGPDRYRGSRTGNRDLTPLCDYSRECNYSVMTGSLRSTQGNVTIPYRRLKDSSLYVELLSEPRGRCRDRSRRRGTDHDRKPWDPRSPGDGPVRSASNTRIRPTCRLRWI